MYKSISLTIKNFTPFQFISHSTSRFCNPDNHIDAGTQGLNKYSYALNNPLKYTDPTGWWNSGGGSDKTQAINDLASKLSRETMDRFEAQHSQAYIYEMLNLKEDRTKEQLYEKIIVTHYSPAYKEHTFENGDIAYLATWNVTQTVELRLKSEPIEAQGGGGGQNGDGWGLSFYSGVPIISSPLVEKGAAFTPGPFVVTSSNINPNTNPRHQDLIRHEIGHVATFVAMGLSFPLYLSTIAIPSAINYQTGWGGDHHSFYTEKIANTFSEWIYGPFTGPNNDLYPSYNKK